MSIPKYNEIMPAVIKLLAEPDVGTVKWRVLEQPLGEAFGLTQEQQATEYDSGNGRIFLDRISWALSYLAMAQLIERPKRGYCNITALGCSLVDDPEGIKTYVKEKTAERDALRRAEQNNVINSDEVDSSLNLDVTPDEAFNQAAQNIRENVYQEILETICNKSPYEFESLVVKLLQKMGYGGVVSEAGSVTQRSSDGGIDGIIKEDVLGLGHIYIQAKRYRQDNTIGIDGLREFVGAIAVAKSNKGVFITTSRYTAKAIEYVENLNGNTSVVLIDGQHLAKYIYDYGLGMQTEKTVVLKRMDSDFWDKMQDDERSIKE